ncbi:UNKNOWN [Stylonychia lemnae]|uniref:Uncharacterized protein n=1 Tax=Stylonychia lemnae TaxID=5949 RepID=A0A077ZWZ2_STYLE|nr:UNKNOWN [Stylonychia lemnae]|eukprot:CDW74111.1 UNKNOWN [Stylonychia lemnae]
MSRLDFTQDSSSKRSIILDKDYEQRLKLYNSIYQGGFKMNISQNTLRNENLKYSFPQAPRFDIQGTDNYYDIPSTLQKRHTNFGIGKKDASYIRKSECPSPNHYKLNRLFDNEVDEIISKQSGRKLKYCSFGLPYKYYEKAVVGPIETQPSINKSRAASQVSFLNGNQSPGPGTYEAKSSLKGKDMKIGRLFKQASFLSQMERISRENPPPAQYNPSYSQIENSKYKHIGFGIGMKMAPMLKLASAKKAERMYLNISESEVRMAPGPGTITNQSKLRRALIEQFNEDALERMSQSFHVQGTYNTSKKRLRRKSGRFRSKKQSGLNLPIQKDQQHSSSNRINSSNRIEHKTSIPSFLI